MDNPSLRNGESAREVAAFVDFEGSQLYCLQHLVSKPKAVVVLAGPFASERPFAYIPWVRWARYLTRHGLSVVRFDYRGMGESTGAFEKLGLHNWRDDLQEMVRRSQAEFAGLPLYLHGLGLGGLLAASIFEQGQGNALLLWSAPESGTDVLREGLMRRISINYVLQPQGPRKGFEDYIAEIKAGQPIYVEGYRWSAHLWDEAGSIRLPAAFKPGGQGVLADGRPWKQVKLNQTHAPLITGLGQWQAINPRAQVQRSPLNPDLDSFFQTNLNWFEQAALSTP